jgi:hypothetical protein
MIFLLLIWVLVCAALMIIGMGRHKSAGLPLAYFLGLSLIHTSGALVYLDTQSWLSKARWTLEGFEQTIIGMVAFLLGVIVARSISAGQAQGVLVRRVDLRDLDKRGMIYFCCGIASFMAMQYLGRIPSVGAIIAALGSLMIVGACLRLWVANQMGNSTKWWKTAILLPLFPLITLIKDGFLGFGTYWMLSAICFATNQSRRKTTYYLLAPIVAYVGLSVFVNYMASRNEFRQLVWYRQAGIEDRLDHVVDMFRNFQFLDLSNSKQVEAIDGRLNQNILVGLAAERLSAGAVDYASGTTIIQTIYGLIPRAIWPGKPAVGGGGSIVSDFTGMEFGEGTSVGAGQVLEFYVNFGTAGVVLGFLIYGWVLGKIDMRVIDTLSRGDQAAFVFWFMIGLAMLQPGGNLLEVVVTMASSAIAGKAIGYFSVKRAELPRGEHEYGMPG